MKHAWDGYVKYAWGFQELSPVSRQGHRSSLFGDFNTGVTIVDSLDTLYIMGMMDEFKQGRDWIEKNLDSKKLSVRNKQSKLPRYPYINVSNFPVQSLFIPTVGRSVCL